MRRVPEHSCFDDQPNVLEDLDKINSGLLELGFSQEQIDTKAEADFAAMDQAFKDAKTKIDANWQREEPTLAYVYFGGHGVVDGLTHAVCGKFASNKPDEWSYAIEHKLRQLAARKGAYVVAVLDCGR